jgi:hypothetical protein
MTKINKLEAKQYINEVNKVITAIAKWTPNQTTTHLPTLTLLDIADLYASSMHTYDRSFVNNIKRAHTVSPKQKTKLLIILKKASKQ